MSACDLTANEMFCHQNQGHVFDCQSTYTNVMQQGAHFLCAICQESGNNPRAIPSAFRPEDAPKADVTHSRINHLRLAGCRAVSETVIRSAKK